MKKSILNLGKVLNKAEQLQVNGGIIFYSCCVIIPSCPSNNYAKCSNMGYVCEPLEYGEIAPPACTQP